MLAQLGAQRAGIDAQQARRAVRPVDASACETQDVGEMLGDDAIERCYRVALGAQRWRGR